MPSCSTIDLAGIRRSFKLSSWIWSISPEWLLFWVVQDEVEKSPLLNWANQFLIVAYDGACSPNISIRMAWISFGALLCGGKKLDEIFVPMLLKSRASPECLPSAFVTRKDLQFDTRTDPSFQRHYRFRPAKSERRSGYWLISNISYKSWYRFGRFYSAPNYKKMWENDS